MGEIFVKGQISGFRKRSVSAPGPCRILSSKLFEWVRTYLRWIPPLFYTLSTGAAATLKRRRPRLKVQLRGGVVISKISCYCALAAELLELGAGETLELESEAELFWPSAIAAGEGAGAEVPKHSAGIFSSLTSKSFIDGIGRSGRRWSWDSAAAVSSSA